MKVESSHASQLMIASFLQRLASSAAVNYFRFYR